MRIYAYAFAIRVSSGLYCAVFTGFGILIFAGARLCWNGIHSFLWGRERDTKICAGLSFVRERDFSFITQPRDNPEPGKSRWKNPVECPVNMYSGLSYSSVCLSYNDIEGYHILVGKSSLEGIG